MSLSSSSSSLSTTINNHEEKTIINTPINNHEETKKVESQLGYKFNLVLFQPKKTLKLTHKQLLPESKLNVPLPSTFHIPVRFVPYDQGPIGSCTANALCACFILQQTSVYDPSRLFHYYVTRELGNLLGQEGAYLDDAYIALKNTGVCRESTWNYNVTQRNIRPPVGAYTEAKGNRIDSWGVVSSGPNFVNNIKQVIINSKPVVIGILVYQSFEGNHNGIIPMPNTSTEGLLGGHAITIIGYDDTRQAFLLLNSWGGRWGCSQPGIDSYRGFCWLPYAYISNPNLCDEALFINNVIITSPPIPQPIPIPPPPPPPQPRPQPPPPRPRPRPPQPRPRPRRPPQPRPRPRPRPRRPPQPRRPPPRPRRLR